MTIVASTCTSILIPNVIAERVLERVYTMFMFILIVCAMNVCVIMPGKRQWMMFQ